MTICIGVNIIGLPMYITLDVPTPNIPTQLNQKVNKPIKELKGRNVKPQFVRTQNK